MLIVEVISCNILPVIVSIVVQNRVRFRGDARVPVNEPVLEKMHR